MPKKTNKAKKPAKMLGGMSGNAASKLMGRQKQLQIQEKKLMGK